MLRVQVAKSEKYQLAIHVLVCVHTRKALINHQDDVGAWRGGEGGGAPSGGEDSLQSSLRDREEVERL